jgi:hypothetical protein
MVDEVCLFDPVSAQLGTRYATGDRDESPLVPSPPERLPIISPE